MPFQKLFPSTGTTPATKSIANITSEITTDVIATIIVLFCNSFHVGQDTL